MEMPYVALERDNRGTGLGLLWVGKALFRVSSTRPTWFLCTRAKLLYILVGCKNRLPFVTVGLVVP